MTSRADFVAVQTPDAKHCRAAVRATQANPRRAKARAEVAAAARAWRKRDRRAARREIAAALAA